MDNVHTRVGSPVGELTLIAGERGLKAVLWENDAPTRVRLDQGDRCDDHPVLAEAAVQLAQYFGGARTQFSVPLDFAGTDFQAAVWRGLLDIPFGETRSYLELAVRLGKPRATRAVGAANGRIRSRSSSPAIG